jgi:hypothetical protein
MNFNVLVTKHIPEECLVELKRYSHIYIPKKEDKSFSHEEILNLV